MITDTSFIVFVFCLIGCAFSAWRLGHKEGVEDAIQYMLDHGLIELEDLEETEE